MTGKEEISISAEDPDFYEHEQEILHAAMDHLGTDVPIIIDALHHLTVKLAVKAGFAPEKTIEGQSRHVAMHHGEIN